MSDLFIILLSISFIVGIIVIVYLFEDTYDNEIKRWHIIFGILGFVSTLPFCVFLLIVLIFIKIGDLNIITKISSWLKKPAFKG